MDWRVKAVAQNILANMPMGERINDVFQLKMGGLRDFDAQVRAKLHDWSGMMSLLSECGMSVLDATTLEIGTGWFPALPVCFWLAGTKSCVSYDLRVHLRLELLPQLVSSLKQHIGAIAQAGHLPAGTVQRRYGQLGGDVLGTCGMTYIAPGDAASTKLPDSSIDIVYSNSVLEHVSPDVLPGLMREMRRVLRPAGVMVHCVACNDHYANFDRKISYVNFLRYSSKEWRRWNNSLQYQNRLRSSDFLRVAENSGFRLIAVKRYVRHGVKAALQSLPVAEEFNHYDATDLATTTVNFACQAL